MDNQLKLKMKVEYTTCLPHECFKDIHIVIFCVCFSDVEERDPKKEPVRKAMEASKQKLPL